MLLSGLGRGSPALMPDLVAAEVELAKVSSRRVSDHIGVQTDTLFISSQHRVFVMQQICVAKDQPKGLKALDAVTCLLVWSLVDLPATSTQRLTASMMSSA